MAVQSELESLESRGTFEIVDRRAGMDVMKGKWVFAVKENSDGYVTRYKARYVMTSGGENQTTYDAIELWSVLLR